MTCLPHSPLPAPLAHTLAHPRIENATSAPAPHTPENARASGRDGSPIRLIVRIGLRGRIRARGRDVFIVVKPEWK
eukprot:scaffold8683_cov104-Isochrysis_galbana.AAC.3